MCSATNPCAGAGACAIVFSTVDRQSFEALDKWRRKVQDECGDGIVLTLVQNKIDLVKEAKMSEEEVAAVARRWGVPLFRTCVKDNTNVNELFTHMATQYIVSGGDTSGVAAMPALGSLAGQGGSAAPAAPAESEEADEASEGSLTDSGTASTGAASGGAGSSGHAGGKPRPGPLSASRSHDVPSEGKAPVTPRTPHSPREEKVITTEDEDVSPPAANARAGGGDASGAGASAAAGAPGSATSTSGVSAGGGSSVASTGAAAGLAKPAAAAGGAAGEAPLPMPPTSSGAFKLTAEPKINKKKKRGFGVC